MKESDTAVPGPGASRHVCMIAYTNYLIDGRVRREAETLAANGFNVVCLSCRNESKPAEFVMNGVRVRELEVPKYRGKSTPAYVSSYVRFLFGASSACLGLLMRGKLDVVHVHNMPDFLVVAGLVPRLAGRKVVLDVHDSVPETFAAKFSSGSFVKTALRLEERWSAGIAHKVICVNHPQRDRIVSRGIPRSKTFVSMNVPDPAIFKRPPQPAPHRANHFNLVYHGTMVERLGVDLIIKAVAELRSRDRASNLRLHLCGNGDDLADFQRLAKELQLEDVVCFQPKGYPLQELPEYLRSMDLGVVANRRGDACDLMLPVKLVEYVSLGIPTIAPRLRTIEHYFRDDMITYYEPENVSSLADAIDRLARAPDRRRQQADRASRFLEEYGWERQGVDLVTFYQNLTNS